MKTFKRIFCLIGNYLPPKLNNYFYKFAGVKFNTSKVWVGNKCYFDTQFPENIIIKNNVCISYGVTILCHFDASESIKKHPIKKYKKETILEEGVFVGAKAIIMPGVTIKRNTFIIFKHVFNFAKVIISLIIIINSCIPKFLENVYIC